MDLYIVVFNTDENDYVVEVMNQRQLEEITDRSRIVAQTLVPSDNFSQVTSAVYANLAETLHIEEAGPFRELLLLIATLVFDIGRHIEVLSQQNSRGRNN